MCRSIVSSKRTTDRVLKCRYRHFKTVTIVRQLARTLDDAGIAGLLNRLGKRTVKGNSWNKSRVASLRASNGIAVFRKGERAERGELTLNEVADRFQVSQSHVRRLIQSDRLPARQACKGAPWIILEDDLDAPGIRAILEFKGSASSDPQQPGFAFPAC